MTESKDIMKEITRKQKGAFSQGQIGRMQHVDNSIAAEICPDCGSDIFINVEALDQDFGRTTTSFECSTCEWKNYDYAEHRL